MISRPLPVLVLVLVLAGGLVPAQSSAGSLGGSCPTGAIFSSLECRLGALLGWAQGTASLTVKVQKKVSRLLLRASTQVTSAHTLSDRRRRKPARAKLAKANRGLAKVETTLEGLTPVVRPRGVPPATTPAEAAAYCRDIRTDIETVRQTLVVGSFLFGEICCIRVCSRPPGTCALVDAVPCSTLDCELTAACLKNGCAIVPTPVGTTCAQFLPQIQVCDQSPTCPSDYANCVAP
jgi:hypothetical protein